MQIKEGGGAICRNNCKNETVISDTKINDIQTCEAKTEIDETQMRETKKDTLTGGVYLKAQKISDAFILNELTIAF